MEVLESGKQMKKGAVRGRDSRNLTATTKLTIAEYARVGAAASSEGKTMGEWLRDIALKTVDASPGFERFMLLFSEVVGIRLLAVNVLRSVATGQIMTPEVFDRTLDEIARVKHELAKKLASEGKK